MGTCNTMCYRDGVMRTIVNISLTKQLNQAVDKAVGGGQYSSKSEFFRDLLRSWLGGELKLELNKSRRELEAGRGKTLRSLKDLR